MRHKKNHRGNKIISSQDKDIFQFVPEKIKDLFISTESVPNHLTKLKVNLTDFLKDLEKPNNAYIHSIYQNIDILEKHIHSPLLIAKYFYQERLLKPIREEDEPLINKLKNYLSKNNIIDEQRIISILITILILEPLERIIATEPIKIRDTLIKMFDGRSPLLSFTAKHGTPEQLERTLKIASLIPGINIEKYITTSNFTSLVYTTLKTPPYHINSNIHNDRSSLPKLPDVNSPPPYQEIRYRKMFLPNLQMHNNNQDTNPYVYTSEDKLVASTLNPPPYAGQHNIYSNTGPDNSVDNSNAKVKLSPNATPYKPSSKLPQSNLSNTPRDNWVCKIQKSRENLQDKSYTRYPS